MLAGTAAAALALSAPAAAQFELVLGEEHFEPGIVLIFEGAVRDHVEPTVQHLAERYTEVHIEARANWEDDEAMIPPGTPPGGFVGYMHVNARIRNEMTGQYKFVTLTPHVNLIDSLHYARNIALPGEAGDPYEVTFFVDPPSQFALAKHRDWLDGYGELLFEPVSFTYEGVNFMEIVNAPPRLAAIVGGADAPE